MKRHRWVRTEILSGLGMQVTYKFGTTSENSSFTLTYGLQDKPIIGYAEYHSPRLQGVIRWPMPIQRTMPVDVVNETIWRTLTDLEREGRATN